VNQSTTKRQRKRPRTDGDEDESDDFADNNQVIADAFFNKILIICFIR